MGLGAENSYTVGDCNIIDLSCAASACSMKRVEETQDIGAPPIMRGSQRILNREAWGCQSLVK